MKFIYLCFYVSTILIDNTQQWIKYPEMQEARSEITADGGDSEEYDPVEEDSKENDLNQDEMQPQRQNNQEEQSQEEKQIQRNEQSREKEWQPNNQYGNDKIPQPNPYWKPEYENKNTKSSEEETKEQPSNKGLYWEQEKRYKNKEDWSQDKERETSSKNEKYYSQDEPESPIYKKEYWSREEVTEINEKTKGTYYNKKKDWSQDESGDMNKNYNPKDEFVLSIEPVTVDDRRMYLNGTLRQKLAYLAAMTYPGHNMVCSPFAAWLPLAKLSFGAKSGSLAQRELLRAIGKDTQQEVEDYSRQFIKDLQVLPIGSMIFASQIFVSGNTKLEESFTDAALNVFESGVSKVSFSEPKRAANDINNWIEKFTLGKIHNVLTPEDIAEPSLITINALHFMGEWRYPFDIVEKNKPFYTPHGLNYVTMMTRAATYLYRKSYALKSQIVLIPYLEHEASFVLVLPDSRQGLPKLLNKLFASPNLINLELDRMERETVILSLPKFILYNKIDLAPLYKEIGLKAIFEEHSEMTNILEHTEVHVSTAIQAIFMHVNEFGIEGSASAMSMVPPGHNVIRVRAEHPFLFYVIAHQEQLFTGTFYEPVKAEKSLMDSYLRPDF